MANKNKALDIVSRKFPESRHLIIELFHQSDFFRSICEDYALCLETIIRLDASKHMIKKGYKKEYEDLLQDLENELISKLENLK